MGTLLYGGLIIAAAGTVVPLFLPSAPAAIQGNVLLQPVGSFIISNQNVIVLLGLAMIVTSLVLGA